MFRYLYSILILCLFAVTALAQNPLGPLYTIQGAGTIAIDGDLADWSHAEWVDYDASTVSETGGRDWNGTDATCSFAMLYDAEALYLAAEVQEDVISYNTDNTQLHAWWERDGVQWFLDFTGNPEQEIILYPDVFFDWENTSRTQTTWLPGEMIAVIGATEDQSHPTTRRWPVGTRDGDRSDSSDFELEDGSTVRGEVNEAWQSVVIVDGSNYVIEVKIPWDSLEESQFYSDPEDVSEMGAEQLDQLGWEPRLPDPLAGSTILMTHLLIDVDLPEGGFDSQVMWVGDGDEDVNWTQATFAEIEAVDAWPLQ